MNLDFSAEETAFRDEVRAFVRASVPADIARKVLDHRHLSKEDQVRWQDILAAKGWLAGHWPREFGGCGWTPVQVHIFDEEAAAAGAPRLIPFGLNMVAPVIMAFGSPWQKEHYLTRIRENKDWWCQGYSEPGSGSDLASLKMRALRDGEGEGAEYVVSGQKTWTTLAQHADMIFCLVRTSTEGGKGWTYAKFLLGHERTNIAGVGASKRELATLKAIARSEMQDGRPLIENPAFAAKIALLEIELMALEVTVMRVLAARGKAPGAESSILKIKGTEIQQTLTALMMEALGPYAQPFVPEEGAVAVGPDYAAPLAARYFNMRKTTIYGGSNEVQRNIIAQLVLGL